MNGYMKKKEKDRIVEDKAGKGKGDKEEEGN